MTQVLVSGTATTAGGLAGAKDVSRMLWPPLVSRLKMLPPDGVKADVPVEKKLKSPTVGAPQRPPGVVCPMSSEWKSSVPPPVFRNITLKSEAVKTPFPDEAPDTVSWKFWNAFENEAAVNDEKPGLLNSDVSSVKVAVAEAPLLNCAPDHSACMSIRSARETPATARTAASVRTSVLVFIVQSDVDFAFIDPRQVCPELFLTPVKFFRSKENG